MNRKDEKKAFGERLWHSLQEAGINPASPTAVAERFNALYGSPVTVPAVKKWLDGASIPSQDRLQVLARLLGVSAQWLRFGEEGEAGRPELTRAPEPPTVRETSALLSLLDAEHHLAVYAVIKVFLQMEGKLEEGA